MKLAYLYLTWRLSLVNAWDSPSVFNHSKVYGTCILTSTKLYYLADRSIDQQFQLNETNSFWYLDFQKDFDVDNAIWESQKYSGSLQPLENSRITSDMTGKMFIATKKDVKSNQADMIVNQFSIKDATWRELSSKNQPPIHYPDTRTVYLSGKNKLLVVGGFDGNMVNGTNSMSLFDLSDNTWSALPNMEQPRANYTINLLNNTIIIIGGVNPIDHKLYPLTQIMKFDISKTQWSELNLVNSDPPQPRVNHMVTVNYNNLYLYGGTDLNERTFYNGIYQLDFNLNKWNKSSTNDLEYEAPVTRGCLASYANYLVIANGYNQLGGAGTKLIDSNNWTIVSRYSHQNALDNLAKMNQVKFSDSSSPQLGVIAYSIIGASMGLILIFGLYKWYRMRYEKSLSEKYPEFYFNNEKIQNYPTWFQRLLNSESIHPPPIMQLMPVWSEVSMPIDASLKENNRHLSKLFRLSGFEPDRSELAFGITECIQPVKPPQAVLHGDARDREDLLEGVTIYGSNTNFHQMNATDITIAIIPPTGEDPRRDIPKGVGYFDTSTHFS